MCIRDSLHRVVLVGDDRRTFASNEQGNWRSRASAFDAPFGAVVSRERGVNDVFLGIRGARQHAVVRDVLPAEMCIRDSH